MDVKFLRYFVEVAEQRSINKAAEVLYVTQPSLSRAIHSLENEVGQALFVRSNHGVVLTPVGENLYHYAKSIVSQLDAIEKIRFVQDTPAYSKLSVAMARLVLQDDLMLQYYRTLTSPNAILTIQETNVEQAIELVSSLQAELGVVAINVHQRAIFQKVLQIKDLEAHPIGQSRLYVHLGRDNPLVRRKRVAFEDLCACTYLHLPLDYFTHLENMLKLGGIRRSDYARTITMSNYHAIINMVKRTDAFIFGGRWQVEELARCNIVSIAMTEQPELELVWVKRKRENLSDEAQAFLQLILDTYQDN